MTELYQGKKENVYQVVVKYYLSTCFTLLDVPILRQCLRTLGENQSNIEFFYSYLTEKKIMTAVDGELSKEVIVSVGEHEVSCITASLLLLMTHDVELFIE